MWVNMGMGILAHGCDFVLVCVNVYEHVWRVEVCMHTCVLLWEWAHG